MEERKESVVIESWHKEEKRKKGLLILFFIMLMAIIVLLSVLLLRQSPAQELEPALQMGMREANASIGQFEGKSMEEIQEELNRVVEKGMFNISINSEIEMKDGASDAEIRVENVPGNQYLMSVNITLDDTGESIYRSGLIEPNYYVQSVRFDKILPKGTYKATAVFSAYELDTEVEVGTAAAKIVIKVQE